MRQCFVVGFLACTNLAFADKYDVLIKQIGTNKSGEISRQLWEGPPIVDEKLLHELRRIVEGSSTHNKLRDPLIVHLICHRYWWRGTSLRHNDSSWPPNRPPYDPNDFRGVKLALRLPKPLFRHTSGYFVRRGPKFYNLLLRLAYGRDETSRINALNFLRITARCNRDKPTGDPALIRLFRREQDWKTLGWLRDRESIPQLRAMLLSGKRGEATAALSLMM